MREFVRKSWHLLERRERAKVIVTLAALMASSLVQMLGVGSILPFVAVLSSPGIIQKNHWLQALYNLLGFTSEHRFLIFLGLCSLGAVLVSNTFMALNQWITVRVSASIQNRLAIRLFEMYLNSPYVLHLRRSPPELKRNVLEETERFMGAVMLVLQLVASALIILCIAALLLTVNPLLSLAIGVLVGGGYSLFYLVIHRRVGRMGYLRMGANAQRFKMVDEGLGGFKELKVMGRTPWTVHRFAQASGALTGTTAWLTVLGTLPRFFIEVLGFGGMLLVVLYLLASHSDIRNTIPLVSLFAFAGYRMLPAMQSAYNTLVGLRFYAPVVYTLEDEMRPAKETTQDGIQDGEAISALPFRRAVELEKVSFRFSEERGYALRDVTFTIPYRAFVGFVGETGAGKSTLADVILGLLPPESGEMRVDGAPLRGSAVRRWQLLLGYVPQEVYLAADTIEANIALGLPTDKVDHEAVREAARLAQLQGFIETELPEGYQTLVGDRGIRLSGGQRQRIGIARALYHHPEVLILDEATSMLDGETEAGLLSAIESLSHKVTLIVIAHRLTTVRHADTIYLLDKGAVIAQGTHAELMENNLHFQRMARGAS
jgi:ABC-type multidrug transport system fused ATPase/permease subunit